MKDNIPHYSVLEVNRAIKSTIENAFGYVKVSGEISGFKKASSGHLYFNLKEENSLLTAVCFRNQVKNIDFEIGDGLQICAYGQITTYDGRSNYQIIVDKIEIAGIGAILEMIEKRKQKLASEGLFDDVYKKPLPYFPKIVAVITSETGAVIEDIKHRIQDRCPLHLILYPSIVQGDKAPNNIIAGIKYFNNLKNDRPEIIIIARGGGSFEDLLAFSDENLVREVFNSEIPIISAIGHETDFTLIDLVADVRAPTPTAAAEFATPVLSEIKLNFDNILKNIENSKINYFDKKLQELANINKIIVSPQKYLENIENKFIGVFDKIFYIIHNSFNNQLHRNQAIKIEISQILRLIENHDQKVNYYFDQIIKFTENDFSKKNILINALSKTIKSNNYFQIIERGFAVIRDKNKKLITNSSDLEKHSKFIVEMIDGQVEGFTASFGSKNNLLKNKNSEQSPINQDKIQSSIFDLIEN